VTIDYTLKKGNHDSPEAGMCAMEWVAYIAREKHSDQPQCVSPILRSFCINLNDALDDEMRQRLRPYLTRCIGTAGDGRDEERGYLCLDWIVRTYTPTWLRLAGLDESAEKVEALDRITDLASAKAAGPIVRDAREKAYAAWAAAGAAAWDAARAAARAAAGYAAWDTARAAAGAALKPTVRELQESAFSLLDRMLPTEAVEIPEPMQAEYDRLLTA
jgi:hypothetical protein